MSKRDHSEHQHKAIISPPSSPKEAYCAGSDSGSGVGISGIFADGASPPASQPSNVIKPAARPPYPRGCPIRVLFNEAAAVKWSQDILSLTVEQRIFFQRADIRPELINLWLAFAKMLYTQKGVPYFSVLDGEPALLLLCSFWDEAMSTLQFCLEDEDEKEDKLSECAFARHFLVSLSIALGLNADDHTAEARTLRRENRARHLEQMDHGIDSYRQTLAGHRTNLEFK